MPLYTLLGGRCRDAVPVCWVAYIRLGVPLNEELAAFTAEVETKMAEGLQAFKMKVGEGHERDMARVRRFREIAPETYLRVDASGAWTEAEAVRYLRDMAAAGVNACETPVDAVARPIVNDHPERINDDPDAAAATLARVREQSDIDIIEHVADLDDAFTAALVRHRAVDIANIIPSQGGGVLRAQRLIHTAQSAGIPVLLGSTVELGPGTAAFVHLAVACDNVSVSSDLVGPGLLVDDVCTTPFEYQGGALRPFDGPGLGVELDEAKMQQWAA
jgi:muconate cycloisomerase